MLKFARAERSKAGWVKIFVEAAFRASARIPVAHKQYTSLQRCSYETHSVQVET